MKLTLPGQLDMGSLDDNLGDDHAELAKRKSNAPLRPATPQQPMDFGLFGDEANQMDLIEMFMD